MSSTVNTLGQPSGFNPTMGLPNTINQQISFNPPIEQPHALSQQYGFNQPIGQSNNLSQPLAQTSSFNEPLNQPPTLSNIYNPALVQTNNYNNSNNFGNSSNLNQQPTFQPIQNHLSNCNQPLSIYNQRTPSGKINDSFVYKIFFLYYVLLIFKVEPLPTSYMKKSTPGWNDPPMMSTSAPIQVII